MELIQADFPQAAARLGAALAVGLVVGLERGWRDRDLPDGGRVAGLRTFALIGLLGGALGIVGTTWPAAAGLVGVALLFAVSFKRAAAVSGTLSITTAIAGLVTYALGVLASQGHVLLAVGTATVVALLLDLKDELHRGIRQIAPAELDAVLQLGVLTVVVLPLLPDAGYGPYEALNPFRLWVAVLLIAGLSLAGHAASRWRGAHQGLLWAAMLGSLASSTAATLALARAARAEPTLAPAAGSAAVAACGVMFVRMAVVVSVLQPRLATSLGALLMLMAVACLAAGAVLWWRKPPVAPAELAPTAKVFDLPTAVGFGLMLGAVALLARAAREHLGESGLYGVAFVSGLTDVDAITISTIGLVRDGTAPVDVAAQAIALAVLANMVVKATMAWFIGGRAVGQRVAGGYAAALAVGGIALAATVA